MPIAVARTVLVVVVVAWFVVPDHRFVAIPVVVVLVFLVSIAALARRRLPEASSA